MLNVHRGFVKIHFTEICFQKLTFGKYSHVSDIKIIRGNLKSQYYIIIVLIVIMMSIILIFILVLHLVRWTNSQHSDICLWLSHRSHVHMWHLTCNESNT